MDSSDSTPKKRIQVGCFVFVGDNQKALEDIADRLRRFAETPQGKALAEAANNPMLPSTTLPN